MVNYPAIIYREDSAFGVSFPDFPGCVSAAATADQAVKEAAEALQLHVNGMKEDREPIPSPSGLEAVIEQAVSDGGTVVYIRVHVPS